MTEVYRDKNGKEIKAGMVIVHDDSKDVKELVYKSDNGGLGINASNENFKGFDPFYRELYNLENFVLSEWEIISE